MSRLVIKIGGSFLTRKDLSDVFPTGLQQIESQKDRFIRSERLLSITHELLSISKRHQMMAVHGAGPFGHALVDRILTGTRILPTDIHRSMLILNVALGSQLSAQGLRWKTTSPLDTVEYDGTFRTRRLVTTMKRNVEAGWVSLSHGDVVKTRSIKGTLGKYEVISGDIVARDLALGWPADRIVMVTDTDGILDRDPALGPGTTLPRIGYAECLQLLRGRGGRGADVTGGIANKIAVCEGPISIGIPLQIISGTRKGDLVAACEGLDVGTTIEPR